MSKNAKKHHHLIAGELTFTPPGAAAGTINTIKVNGVLITNGKGLLMRDIGRAQQVLQMNLHSSIGEPGTEIHNVIILAIVHLGCFTEEEWKQNPDGQQLKERPKLHVVKNDVPAPTAEVDPSLSPEEAMQQAQQKQVDADLGTPTED